MRKFGMNRWNWSQKAEKWVYVEMQGGKRKYHYQLEPPKEFLDLSSEIIQLNKKMVATKDEAEIKKIYDELINISKRLQSMGR